MLPGRNGTPESRTPSPPGIRAVVAHRPLFPAPEKRRPVRARSQTSLTRTSPSSTPSTSRIATCMGYTSRRPCSPRQASERTSPVSSSFQADTEDMATKARCASKNSGSDIGGSTLSKSVSSPCLLVESLHEQHSQQQQRLITSRTLLSDAFGAFNSANQVQSAVRQRQHTDQADHLRPNAKHGSHAARTLERVDVTIAPSGVCEAIRKPASRDNDVEEKRRKALDAKLLRALAVLGM